MKNLEKKWLEPGSWTSLLTIYDALCREQKVEPFYDKEGFEKARGYWEGRIDQTLSLPQALEVCCQCYQLHPFVFNNGNTFATFAKRLVEGWSQTLPSVESQMLLSTVGHYVTGKASRKELMQILSFLGPAWDKFKATRL